jgi:hypothetical protein
MLSRQTIGEVIEAASTMLRRAEVWRHHVEEEGEDAATTVEAREILRDRFDPLWNQMLLWHAVHRSETHWKDLEEQNPRLARAARRFSMAVKAAMKGLFPMGFEVIIPNVETRCSPDSGARKWQALDGMKVALEELRAAFEEGPKEFWIPASEVEKHTGNLGRKVSLTELNRLAKNGKIKSRETGPGSKHKREIEVGAFFRWYFDENRGDLKP